MKVYKSKRRIVLEWKEVFYEVHDMMWDDLFQDDEIYFKLFRNLSENNYSKTEFSEVDPPISSQELWASGVTYFISKEGRQEESQKSGGAQFYAKVYEAERPELFFKATAHRIIGHLGKVRIRKDSSWNVPEPELTLAINRNGKIIGYTIGNDMSSRSIEGENPLYLPQAKTYDGCAALGPCIFLSPEPLEGQTMIHINIVRESVSIFSNAISIDQMKRSHQELVSFLYRECSFPNGSFLMTGTGIVPPKDFTLKSGDRIIIDIDKIGRLENQVE